MHCTQSMPFCGLPCCMHSSCPNAALQALRAPTFPPPNHALFTCPCTIPYHETRDTYFGGYSSDAKSGAGLYVFTTGAAYLGAYEGGKRHGQGLLLLPDGGMYRGGFVGDKYEGEVRRLASGAVGG